MPLSETPADTRRYRLFPNSTPAGVIGTNAGRNLGQFRNSGRHL